MATINLFGYAQGVYPEPTVVYDTQTRSKATRDVEHKVKFVLDFESPIYKELTFEEIIDWFARQIAGDSIGFAKCKEIYLARPITKEITHEEAFNLGFVTQKQKPLKKYVKDLDQSTVDVDIKQHLKSGWVQDIDKEGEPILKLHPKKVEVFTGFYRRSRREIKTIEDIQALKDEEVIEVVFVPFVDIPCIRCNASLNANTGVSIGHNRILCKEHLKVFAKRIGMGNASNEIIEQNLEKLVKLYIEESDRFI